MVNMKFVVYIGKIWIKYLVVEKNWELCNGKLQVVKLLNFCEINFVLSKYYFIF